MSLINNVETGKPTRIWKSGWPSLLSAGFVFLCVSLGASATDLSPQQVIRISAAEHGTGIYRQASQLAEVFSEQSRTTENSPSHTNSLGVALSSGGTIANIQDLTDGRAEFAIVNSMLANEAYSQPELSGPNPAIDRLRLVSTLQPYVLQILVRQRDNLTATLKDLKNATVSLGLSGARTKEVICELMENQGVPVTDMTLRHYPLQLSIRKLRDGHIDALILLDSAQNSVIAPLIEEGILTLATLDESTLQQFLDSDVAAGLTKIKKSPYAGTTTNPDSADFVSVKVDAYLLAQDTISATTMSPVIEYLKKKNELAHATSMSNTSFDGPYRMEGIASPIPMHDSLRSNTPSQEDSVTADTTTDPISVGDLDDQ